MKIGFRIVLAISIIAMALLIAGCSSGGAGLTPSDSPSATPISSVTSTPEVTSSAAVSTKITTQDARTLIHQNADNPKFAIIDVRTPAEYDSGHLEGAINIDYNSTGFKSSIDQLDRGNIYLVYCRTGARSANAVKAMIEMGLKTVYDMSGGITQWEKDSYIIVTSTATP